jgi:hypothetical protein
MQPRTILATVAFAAAYVSTPLLGDWRHPLPKPAPKPAPAAGRVNTGNPLVPDWVQPGLRLTYDLLTGGVNRSVDEQEWNPKTHEWWSRGTENFDKERASHGLVQTTVAGVDGQIVALSQPFYLLSPGQRAPVLLAGKNIDMLVTADTGGDLWMHPQRQAQMLKQYPATGAPTTAQTTVWRDGNQSWTATAILTLIGTSKSFSVYDQASGRLLYLSRISRDASAHGRIHDENSPTKRAMPSYGTFLRFVGARQMNLPWLGMPLPDWERQLQALNYQGRQSVQFPGAAPGGQALAQMLQVKRRGANWLLFQSTGQAQWQMNTGPGPEVVEGPGLSVPFIIPPAGLARLRPGQEIDRDPLTGFVARVAAADQKTVTLQVDGPDRTMMFAYDRAQGVVMHSTTRERGAGVNQFIVREMQLAGKR